MSHMFRKYLKQALLSEIVAVPLSDTFLKVTLRGISLLDKIFGIKSSEFSG